MDQYIKLKTSTKTTVDNWLGGRATTLDTLLAESTSQADVVEYLKEWENNPMGVDKGWLARFVRTFYYDKLGLMSTCFWQDNDLVYANLKNVRTTTKDGDVPVTNMDGFTWLTAADARNGTMMRFSKGDEGKYTKLDPTVYKFDLVNTYQLTPIGTDAFNAAINGLGDEGDRVNIEGDFGICNDRTYQFGQFAQRIGIYIAIGIAVIAIIFVMLDHGIQRTHGASFENPMMVAASGGKESGEGESEEI